MVRCSKCVMPDTTQSITFDENGVCSLCKNHDLNNSRDFEEKENELRQIFEKYKGTGHYDCLVPYSGGKDSAYVLYICKKYGMNPLAYNFNNHFQTKIGKRNMNKIVKELGVDLITFAPDYNVVKKLCKKGIAIKLDFCWFCNAGVYATSVQRALKENITLVVFGEHAAEYESRFKFDDGFEKLFKEICQEGISEEEFLDKDISRKDMKPYTLPEGSNKLEVIYLNQYIKWDKDKIKKELREELGWKEGDRYEHIDCKYSPVRDFFKFENRGFGRNTQLASLRVRNGEITREEALIESRKDGALPDEFKDFCEEVLS